MRENPVERKPPSKYNAYYYEIAMKKDGVAEKQPHHEFVCIYVFSNHVRSPWILVEHYTFLQ